MKNVVRHIVTGTMMLLVLWCTSCSHDTETFGISDPETALSIGLRVPAKSPKTGEGYAIGETYENYIDVENNNYRIYFFTSLNDKSKWPSVSSTTSTLATARNRVTGSGSHVATPGFNSMLLYSWTP